MLGIKFFPSAPQVECTRRSTLTKRDQEVAASFGGLFTQSPYRTFFDERGYVSLIDRSSSHPVYLAADFAWYQR